MTKIISALIDQGYQVVAVDLPGHGASPWQTILWQDSVKALLKVQDYFGNFDLGVGHSYGGTMLLSSTSVHRVASEIKGHLALKKIILLASPIRITSAIQIFSRRLRLNQQQNEHLTSLIERDSGVGVDKLDGIYLLNRYPSDLTVATIHDKNDRVVPFRDSEDLSSLGPRFAVHQVDNVGHIGVIFAPRAVRLVSLLAK